jgi:hypothetical protein
MRGIDALAKNYRFVFINRVQPNEVMWRIDIGGLIKSYPPLLFEEICYTVNQ